MNGIKIFFLSLVILSLAMGQNWFKNRSKNPPKKLKKPVTSQPVDLDAALASTTASATMTASQAENASGLPSLVGSGTPIASDTAVASSSEAEASESLALETIDPIISAWEKLPRTPFEPSPFVKILAELGKTRDTGDGAVVVKKKETRRLDAPFTGIIETDKYLMAVIGGKLFKDGDIFQDKTIKKLGTEVINLEDSSANYLLPKKGIKVDIASDGTYAIVGDDYKK